MTFLSHAVRDSRLEAMRKLMDRQRFDALILTAADFFQYATNFHVDVQPWERPIMVAIPRNGAPRAIMNELSTHHMMMARSAAMSGSTRWNSIPSIPRWRSVNICCRSCPRSLSSCSSAWG